MNLRNFQSFLDAIASRRPEHLPFQKLRILNAIAIRQEEGTLSSAPGLIDFLGMRAERFQSLADALIKEDLLTAFPCSWNEHQCLFILTETGANQVSSLIDLFQPPAMVRARVSA